VITAATAVDTANVVGRESSIAIGFNGDPIISFRDVTNGDLRFAACSDPDCLNPADVRTLDSVGDVGRYTSLQIGADAMPVMSYWDATNGDLKVIRCSDRLCVGALTITAVDTVGVVGQSTSLEIGIDGFPVIAYRDVANSNLKVVKCNDSACIAGGETITTVDARGVVGLYISLAIGADGFPVVSYWDEAGADLMVLKCNDVACSGSGDTATAVDSASDVGSFSSIAIGTDGFPVISYKDATSDELKVAKCNDPGCVGNDETISVVDGAGISIVGNGTSLAIAASGFPVISYYAPGTADLRLAECNDTACAGGDETITTLDGVGTSVGLENSIVLGVGANPVISYYDATGQNLKVIVVKHNSYTSVG
jgi:hypothetical protein